jgi:hypothetical protein
VELSRNLILRNDAFGVRADNAGGLEVRDSVVANNDGVDLRTSESTELVNITFNRSSLDFANVSGLFNTSLSGVADQIDLNETDIQPIDPNNAENIGVYFNATNRTSSFFNASVGYADADVSGVDESSLALWRYDGSWTKLPGSTVDTAANTVSANITDFSAFAPLADTGVSGGPGAGDKCVDRRDVSRGQESQQCPKGRGLSRGESREDLDRATGRNSDTRRRDRSRGERGRSR